MVAKDILVAVNDTIHARQAVVGYFHVVLALVV